MKRLIARRVAVLGAGVMGAQIAAHFANAGIPVRLYDLPGGEGDRRGVARAAVQRLLAIEPAPLVEAARAALIEPASFDDDAPLLADCDLVIEAVAERMDIKRSVYARVAPHLAAHAVFASNTSGIPIADLAAALPAGLQPRFCGVHFFNPPRYMPLVELIAGPGTLPAVLDALETFLTSTLGKSVVRALDTPNFIANRVGIFALLVTVHHAQRLGLGFDVVDALTGPPLGHPRSGTFRLMDLIGLDTMANILRTFERTLAADPWHAHYGVPAWMAERIAAGALGQKTRGGLYRKGTAGHEVFDPLTGDYRSADGRIAPEVAELIALRDEGERLRRLRVSSQPQAQLLWSVQRDLFHYCAHHLQDIAPTARDVDLAMRWGYGWQRGPFEQWQAAGWQETAGALAADIESGVAMAQCALPEWVFVDAQQPRRAVHEGVASWSAARTAALPRAALPVHARQRFPDALLGEHVPARSVLFESDDVTLWLPEGDADDEHAVPVLSLRTKMGAIGAGAIDGMLEAVDRAEHECAALVLWQPQGPFSVGANLRDMSALMQQGDLAAIDYFLIRFQTLTSRLAQARVPVVAAVSGMALGGGCEVMMHCSAAALALESTVGLVESRVGLIPGAGGCAAFAQRAARQAAQWGRPGVDGLIDALSRPFDLLAAGRTAPNAQQAVALGFARESDSVVFHPQELLWVAQEKARALARTGWRPSPVLPQPVAGRAGVDVFGERLARRRTAGELSAHDERVGRALARALCGGDVAPGSLADEAQLLAAERHAFIELVATPETAARIRHMLDTGKPLRN